MAQATSGHRPLALITGASAGIGREFSRQIAARAHDVVVVARDQARLDALAKELSAAQGTDVEVLPADLSRASEVEQVEARVRMTDRPIDLLVNNAGFATRGRFDELPLEGELEEIAVNVIAVARLAHAAGGAMVDRGGGAIVNVSSLGARQPAPSMATYAATKAYVSSFSQALHAELASHGVHVMALEPGFTHTEFQARAKVTEVQSAVPEFMWSDPAEVVTAALADLDKRKPVSVPFWQNKVMAAGATVLPPAVTRKLASTMLDS